MNPKKEDDSIIVFTLGARPTSERFPRTKGSFCQNTVILSACLAIGLLTKGGMLMELDVFPSEDDTCKNTVMEYYVDVTEITKSVWYGTIYKFWFRNIATVFLPFFLLLLINLGIVLELRSQMHHAFGNRSRRRFSLRMQSRVSWLLEPFQLKFEILSLWIHDFRLTCVRLPPQCYSSVLFTCSLTLSTYSSLPGNSLILTRSRQGERTDRMMVYGGEFRFIEEYMLSADLSSVLVVTACALRLPIYMVGTHWTVLWSS